MTQIIQSILTPPHNTPPYSSIPSSNPSLSSSSSQPSTPQPYQSLNSQNPFLVTGNSNTHDLLFQLKPIPSYLIIRIYVLTKSGSIFKIHSQSSRIQFIKLLNSYNTLYQPKVHPISGILYFQFAFSHSKFHLNSNSPLPIKQILKQIKLEKLFGSLKKVCSPQSGLDSQKVDKQNLNQIFFNPSITKAIAGSLIDSDIEKDIKAPSISQQNPQKSFSNNFSQFQEFFSASNYHSSTLSESRIRKILKDIENQQLNLNNLMKQKGGKSNFDNLMIEKDAEKYMKELMMKMFQEKFSKESIQVEQTELGKITLNLQKVDDKKFKDKFIFLHSLPKNCEYHFIDKYFKPPINLQILITLSLKQQSLDKFLRKNLMTISLQTKMRIMLQIYGGVNVLWDECKLVYYVGNLKKVLITKNLGLKLRGNSYYKPQKYAMLEERDLLNKRLAQCLVNLGEVYFKIFHNHDPYYIKPTTELHDISSFEHRKKYGIWGKVPMNKYLPELVGGLSKRYVSSLNFLFMEHVNQGKKILNGNKNQQQIDYNDFKQRRQQEYMRQFQRERLSDDSQEKESVSLINTKMVACWLLSTYY